MQCWFLGYAPLEHDDLVQTCIWLQKWKWPWELCPWLPSAACSSTGQPPAMRLGGYLRHTTLANVLCVCQIAVSIIPVHLLQCFFCWGLSPLEHDSSNKTQPTAVMDYCGWQGRHATAANLCCLVAVYGQPVDHAPLVTNKKTCAAWHVLRKYQAWVTKLVPR
jgi:hypothetical protein